MDKITRAEAIRISRETILRAEKERLSDPEGSFCPMCGQYVSCDRILPSEK